MFLRTGFFTDELNVLYIESDEKVEGDNKIYLTSGERNDYYYRIFWLKKGTAVIRVGKSVKKVTDNTMIFAEASTDFHYVIKSLEVEFTYIFMHKTLFNEYYADEMFLRAFNNLKDDDAFIDFKRHNLSFIEAQLESIKKCVFLTLGKNHIVPRVFTIISELDIINDTKYADLIEDTDSQPTKIIDYIHRHYTEKITAKQTAEKFFISFPTLNEIIKLYCNKTFWQFVTDLRLEDARKMLGDGRPGIKVAELCGFSNYSAFYRAYVKKYGIPPSRDKFIRFKKWPLT